MIIGSHISIAKGYAAAARETIEMGGTTFQFFSRNPRGSSIRAKDENDILQFQRLREEYGFGPLCAHAPYTMNLAAREKTVYDFGRSVIKEDVKRMDELGIEYLCVHPGSHVGAGMEEGIRRIIQALNEAVTGGENITVLLETMSGKGTEIGYTFEQLRRIIDGLDKKERFGICFDLCHTFSAGYDIAGQPEAVLADFDEVLSLERLKVVHVNDSMMPFGDKKDRHTPVGEGMIGLNAVIHFISSPRLAGRTFITETPLDTRGHRREIAMLRQAVCDRAADCQ